MARILVLNDDQDMLDTYEAALIELGHEPVTRESTESGPETVRDLGADALVVDLMRPEAENYGLLIIEQIRAEPELQAFPIVLCTGAGDEHLPVLQRLEGLRIPILHKPFRIDDLGATLEKVISEAEPAA